MTNPTRARTLGLAPGRLPTGAHNAITDVAGVRVGHVTLVEGDAIRTGVTLVLPHPGNLYLERVPAGLATFNGFGKLTGATQIDELGELETPIALTNTLSVPAVASGLVDYMLGLPGNGDVRSLNPVVGECNDGVDNDIRRRAVQPHHVQEAILAAQGGALAEGRVGAGTGTRTLGFAAGIGTSSRCVRAVELWTVGVLVQTNFGGHPTDALRDALAQLGVRRAAGAAPPGSAVFVVATDAPLSDRNLRRLARRCFAGMARAGASFGNGSGDYALAFSTHEGVRRTPARRARMGSVLELGNDATSPLLAAVAEAAEEAILNALVAAATGPT